MILLIILFGMFFVVPALLAYAFVWYISYLAPKPDFEMPQDFVVYDEDFGIDISEDFYREHREV